MDAAAEESRGNFESLEDGEEFGGGLGGPVVERQRQGPAAAVAVPDRRPEELRGSRPRAPGQGPGQSGGCTAEQRAAPYFSIQRTLWSPLTECVPAGESSRKLDQGPGIHG